VSARARVSVPLVDARADCQAFDDQSPVLSVETDAVSLTLRPADVVTDEDVRAAWALIDAMRVYVLAVEAARDRRSGAGRPAPARAVPGPARELAGVRS
jgi:hypothetical protein